MKRTLYLGLALLLAACVKDAKDISPSSIFKVTIKNVDFDKANLFADNTLKYTIELAALDGVDIDNDKSVTVSVSEGGLSSVSSLSATPSSQATLTIEGGRAVCYYVPSRSAQKEAIFSISLGGLNQVLNFSLLPVEPTQIQLTANISHPKVTDDIEVTAILTTSSTDYSAVSDNLKVFFTAERATSRDTIDALVAPPTYSISSQNNLTSLVTAKILLSTNRKPGSIIIKANYTKADNSIVQGTKPIQFTR